MKTKEKRLAEFLSRVVNDPFIPSNADDAYEFLIRNLDNVEEASLPSEYINNYDHEFRMTIPDFSTGAWTRSKYKRTWKAIGHSIEIYDNGNVVIKTNDGENWFTR